MIKVKDLALQIKNNCFTEEEIGILEFTINTRLISIDKQIQSYFRNSYYNYDEDSLYIDIVLIKEQNKDILRKIKDYKNIIDISLNPLSYVQRKISDISNEDNRGSVSSSKNDTSSNQTDISDSVNNEYSDTQSLNKIRSAKSETNTIKNLNEVWEDWQINPSSRINKQITENPTTNTYSITLNQTEAPSNISSNQKDHSYQYFDTNENADINYDTSHSNVTSGSKSLGTSTNTSSSSHLSSSNSKKNIKSSELSLGENALKVAEINLPKYRDMFWSKFNDLFLVKWV